MEFRGNPLPKVYFISYDNKETIPFSSQQGNFLSSTLGMYNLILDSRFANLPVQTKETVFKDINECNPQIIVIFGDKGIKDFLETSDTSADIAGDLYLITINDKQYKFMVLQDIDLVLHATEDDPVLLDFQKHFKKLTKIIDGTYVDVLKTKKILNAHSFSEYKNICTTYFTNDTELAYDIETNARPPMTADSRIIGFSLANKTTGVYVSIDSLEWHMPQEEEDNIWEYTINDIFEKEDKLIIHNTMYERPYTLTCKDYEIGFEKAHDTLVMARMLKEPKIPARLKYQAQTILEYPDWETPLTKYKNYFIKVLDKYGLGAKKFDGIKKEIINGTNLWNLVTTNAYNSLKETDKTELYKLCNDIWKLLEKFYDEEKIFEIGKLFIEKINICIKQGGIQDSTIPYNWIPDKILSEYGAVDSIATYDLKEYFFDMMKTQSTDTVDLFHGYNLWLQHMYVAYIMERNGLYWNETRVTKDQQFLENQANNCLYSLLTSPCFEPYIIKLCEHLYKPQILSDYYPHVAFLQGYDVVYNKQTKEYTVKKNGKKASHSAINEITIPENLHDEYYALVKQMYYEDLEEHKNNWEELKEFYNPMSSDGGKIAIEILNVPELSMGARIVKLNTLANSPSFEQKKDTLEGIDKKVINVAELLCNPSRLKEMYGETWASSRRQLYEGFCNLYNYRKSVTTPEIKSILNEKTPVEIDAMDDDGIITVYDNLVVTGIDQDNKNTYTPVFEWMINYRIFKKSAKILTTYIEGSVGHESVYTVKKSDLDNDNHCLKRLQKYNANIPLKSDEFYLLNTSWSPNVANTGRWTSPQHTVPAGSQVKKYYTSRYVGGTMLMPDYSQAEVRTLAAISHDEDMLNVFRSGKDFHTETAKKIFRKEEVTPAERRFSKGATFSLLYGSSVKSFAKSYCEGDMAYAQSVFDGFFNAYPKVREWVDERHKEVQATQKVSLEISGRFIQIPIPPNSSKGVLGKILRQAQNFPIQSQTADLTGGVLFDIQKFIETERLKTLIVMYVHDSIEVDVYPFELIKVISKMKELLISSPQERAGLPAKADVALGYSIGHEIEMESLETNEDYTECTITLKGYKDEIDDTVNNWKPVYKTVDILEENYKDIFVSVSDLFIAKKAYTPTIGTYRKKGTCKLHLNYYN